jgi:hypothetical protein
MTPNERVRLRKGIRWLADRLAQWRSTQPVEALDEEA